MSDENTWDIELDSTSSEAMTEASETLSDVADTTGVDGFDDAAWNADASAGFAADGEGWDAYAETNVDQAAIHLESANIAAEGGDTVGAEWEMQQAGFSLETAEDASEAANTAFDTSADYADATYDTAADTAYDAGLDTSLDTSYDAGLDTSMDTSYDAGLDTSYDTSMDTSFDSGLDMDTDI